MATAVAPKKPAAKKAVAPKKTATSEPVAATAPADTGFILFGAERPKPEPTRGSRVSTQYPFDSVELNGGFEVLVKCFDSSSYANEGEAKKAFKDEQRKIQNRLTGAIRRFGKKDATRKFSVRVTEGGVGVWRDM